MVERISHSIQDFASEHIPSRDDVRGAIHTGVDTFKEGFNPLDVRDAWTESFDRIVDSMSDADRQESFRRLRPVWDNVGKGIGTAATITDLGLIALGVRSTIRDLQRPDAAGERFIAGTYNDGVLAPVKVLHHIGAREHKDNTRSKLLRLYEQKVVLPIQEKLTTQYSEDEMPRLFLTVPPEVAHRAGPIAIGIDGAATTVVATFTPAHRGAKLLSRMVEVVAVTSNRIYEKYHQE